jgi:hypothetical protein
MFGISLILASKRRAVAQFGRSLYRSHRVVCIRGEFRPAHFSWDGFDYRRGGAAVLAGRAGGRFALGWSARSSGLLLLEHL